MPERSVREECETVVHTMIRDLTPLIGELRAAGAGSRAWGLVEEVLETMQADADAAERASEGAEG